MKRRLSMIPMIFFAFVLGFKALPTCAQLTMDKQEYKVGTLTITNLRIPATTTRNAAVFMTIKNNAEKGNVIDDAVLVGGIAPDCERVELHTHVTDAAGVTYMQQVNEGILIKAGDIVELASGGLHIMLIGLKEDKVFQEGTRFPLILKIKNAPDLEVVVPVVRPELANLLPQELSSSSVPATPVSPVSSALSPSVPAVP